MHRGFWCSRQNLLVLYRMWVKLHISRRSKPWPGYPVPCTEERPLDPLTLAVGRSDAGLRNLADIRFVRGSFQCMNGQLVLPEWSPFIVPH